MNRFDREVQRRKKKVLKIAGYGDVPYRVFIGWIRTKLKEDLKSGKVSLR